MAKFHGTIGFSKPVETAPGVFTEEISERPYRGDVQRMSNAWEQSGQVNDNLTIRNRISVIGDPFFFNNVSAMRFVRWAGVCWKISSIEIQRPRLILTIGEVYNGA